MDWSKMKSAMLFPITTLVLLNLIPAAVLILYHSASILLGVVIFFTDLLIFLYAGYLSIKKYRLDLKSATLSGVLIGAVPAAIDLFVAMLLIMLVLPFPTTNAYGSTIAGSEELEQQVKEITLIVTFMGGMVQLLIKAVLGAVLSAVGGFIAEQTKPKRT